MKTQVPWNREGHIIGLWYSQSGTRISWRPLKFSFYHVSCGWLHYVFRLLRRSTGLTWIEMTSVKLPVHCPASNRSSVKNTIRLDWTSQMKSDKAEGAKANIWTAELISHQDYPYNCLVPHSTQSCHPRKPAGPWPFSNPQDMRIEERNVQLFFGMPTVQTLPRKQEGYKLHRNTPQS